MNISWQMFDWWVVAQTAWTYILIYQ